MKGEIGVNSEMPQYPMKPCRGHFFVLLFHEPADEKRMVVILSPERHQDWLNAPVDSSIEFLRPSRANFDHTY